MRAVRCQQKNKKTFFDKKAKKFVIFMKNGKKVLTNREKRAKIVNCIIIARTAHTPPKSDKLYSSNLHKSLDGARLGGYAER
jgi:hypothetical protein